MKTRLVRPRAPVDLALTFMPMRRGAGDPTMQVARGEVRRATKTPEGPGTLRLVAREELIEATAWGPGADWLLEHAPAMCGSDEDPDGFAPDDAKVAALHRRLRKLRLGHCLRVVEPMIPTILEQKVASKEARISYRRMVLGWGEPAPGPLGLRLPPAPELLASKPYYEFHRFGIERRRAEFIIGVCRHAAQLDATCEMPRTDAYRRMRAFRGVGAWTAGEVGAIGFGDPDAVSVGDLHLPGLVVWVLTGESDGDDARMLELLAPFAGNRGRVVRLIESGSPRPPRRGPRAALRSFAKY